jgi:cis-3-alkyl-4-acyloxetan-2-one decarboxylase
VVRPSIENASWREEYPFDSNWLDLDIGGTNIAQMHFVDTGPKDKEAVLFLHGNPTWSFYFREVIGSLSANLRCVAPDHIGCGLSSKPSADLYPYRLARRVDDIVTLIEALDIKRFSLVVHDWGGAIGMGVARRLPDRVNRIVAMNTAAFRSQEIPQSIALCRVPALGAFLVRGMNAFALAAQVRAVTDRKKLRGSLREAYLFPYDSWAHRVAIHEFVRDIPLEKNHPSYATLRQIEEGLSTFENHPVLLLWGLADFCFHKGFYDEWRERFPHAQCHAFKDAGHFVLEDATDQCVEHIEKFLVPRSTL